MNYAGPSPENLKHIKYSHLIQPTFLVLILQISNILSKYNKGVRFLLLLPISLLLVITTVLLIFRVNSWIDPLKDKRDITITSAFQNINIKIQ